MIAFPYVRLTSGVDLVLVVDAPQAPNAVGMLPVRGGEPIARSCHNVVEFAFRFRRAAGRVLEDLRR